MPLQIKEKKVLEIIYISFLNFWIAQFFLVVYFSTYSKKVLGEKCLGAQALRFIFLPGASIFIDPNEISV